MTPLLLATRSEDKAREIRRILEPVGIRVVSLAEAGVDETPEEKGIEAYATFRENALAKATFFVQRCGRAALADDSGLAVTALGGRPGVHSKRFSGRSDLSGRALDEANNRTLLQQLAETPPERRAAAYHCAAVLVTPENRVHVAIGSASGVIATSPAGDGGFGYDPLFFLPELGRTFGQVDPATKDRRSHRARAFRALASSTPHS